MKNNQPIAKFALYFSSWVGFYVIINLLFLLVNYLTRAKAAEDTYDFNAGIFSVNGRSMGLSPTTYLIISIVLLISYLGYKYINRKK